MTSLRKGTTVYAIIRAFYDHHRGRKGAVTLGELYTELEAFAGTALHQRITDARNRYGVKIVHEVFKRDRDHGPTDLYYLDPAPESVEHARVLLEQATPDPRRLRTTTLPGISRKVPITPADHSSSSPSDGTEKFPASQPPAVPSEAPDVEHLAVRCVSCHSVSCAWYVVDRKLFKQRFSWMRPPFEGCIQETCAGCGSMIVLTNGVLRRATPEEIPEFPPDSPARAVSVPSEAPDVEHLARIVAEAFDELPGDFSEAFYRGMRRP